MGQMIDLFEPASLRLSVGALKELEVNIVDRLPFFVSIDQIQRCAANALDRRQFELHGAGRDIDRLRALFQNGRIGFLRIANAKRHAACCRAVFLRIIIGGRFWLIIGDQIDAALAPQIDVFRSVAGYMRETKRFKHPFQYAAFRGREFNNSKPSSPIGFSNKSAIQFLLPFLRPAAAGPN